MTRQENLRSKYYKGESSLEEEKEFKALVEEDQALLAEQDIFSFYANESNIPDGLEEEIFEGVEKTVQHKKTIRMRIYSALASAAVVLILLSVYIDAHRQKRTKMEDSFFVMERALFQVSESLQPPAEEDEMLILWVDDEVEIIIN